MRQIRKASILLAQQIKHISFCLKNQAGSLFYVFRQTLITYFPNYLITYLPTNKSFQ